MPWFECFREDNGWEVREIVRIGKRQYGLMKGRGTANAIFIVKQLREKRQERQ